MTRVAVMVLLALGLVGGAHGAGSGSVTGSVLVNPLSVVVRVPPDPVKVGKDIRIHAEVANAGLSAVQNVTVSLLAPQALVLRDPATQVLPHVGPADVRVVHWRACTTSAGSYVVMARASAGPFTVESAGQLVQLEAIKKQSNC